MIARAVVCVECGYNVETGETPVDDDAGDSPAVPTKKRKKKKRKGPALEDQFFGLFSGIFGGLIGGLIGGCIWYAIAVYANLNIGWVAWGVGGLVGVGVMITGGKHANPDLLGLLSGVIAVGAILGGQYAALDALAGEEYAEVLKESEFQDTVEFAKRCVACKNDQELLRVLEAEWQVKVTPEHLASFKAFDLIQFHKLAEGKLSKRRYYEELTATIDVWAMFKESMGIKTWIFLVLGLATAYKIPAQRGEDS